jgi:hypothetical protein
MKPKKITREVARINKLPRYFTGGPCKYGHVAERWTSNGGCAKCRFIYLHSPEGREESRRRDRARAGQRRAFYHTQEGRQAQWRRNHSPYALDRKRRYELTPKGYENHRRYSQSPKGQDQIFRKRKYKDRIEYQRQYRRANRQKCRAYARRYYLERNPERAASIIANQIQRFYRTGYEGYGGT